MFYKDYYNKPIAIFKAINTTLSMAKVIVKPIALKQKRDWPPNSTNKRAKKNWAAFDFYYVFGLFTRYRYFMY